MRRAGRGPRSLPRLEEPPNDAAVVALRRVRSWKSERQRRLRQRALEIAERCRELRSQFDPGYEWERPVIPEQCQDAPVLVAARRCTCIPGCGHRCAYVAPLETDVWGDEEAASPVSRSRDTGLYEARGQHGPCLTCLGKHLDRCIICMDVLQPGCATTLRGRGDELAALDDPVVRFPCNHYFHSACIRARCEVGAKHNEEGDPLQFDFLHCPLCRATVTLPQSHHPAEGNAPPLPTVALEFLGTQLSRDLAPLLKRQLELRALIWQLAPGEEMYRKVFQVCQRCQLPFCSGSVSCLAGGRRPDDDSGAGVGLGDEPGFPRPRVKLDALCGPCSYALPAGKPRVCTVHGTAAIAWKCRYCCSIATYECFSGRQQLHVCDTCHDPRILEQLFDFDRMDNMLPVGEYGFCPIKRNVHMPNGGRNLRKKGRGGAPKLGRGGVLTMDLSLLRTMERRLAVVTAKAVQADQELEELKACQHILPAQHENGSWGAKKGEPGGALNRLRRKAHSLKVEREDLARLVDGCNLSGKGACHFGGVHPPAGIEYCLGCTLCN